jgi:hypothetical protein
MTTAQVAEGAQGIGPANDNDTPDGLFPSGVFYSVPPRPAWD